MSRDKKIEEIASDLENHTCMSRYQAEIASRILYVKGYRKASEVARDIFEEIARYIRLYEDIAIKCKEENGEQNEEYFKGKLSAFKQIRGFIDVELKRQYKEGRNEA